jgi:hypothetical protein
MLDRHGVADLDEVIFSATAQDTIVAWFLAVQLALQLAGHNDPIAVSLVNARAMPEECPRPVLIDSTISVQGDNFPPAPLA